MALEFNKNPVDKWTAVHAGTGAAAGAIGLSLGWSLLGAVAYEALEYAHEYPKGSVLFGSKRPESGLNIAVDLAVFLGGWWVGRKLVGR